ncbi:MAG TPA: ABC transporter permease [Blastocatellia bacterium]|jgi:putative ABC transport system permease protein|nr:ABC transporter permease [Blastocatellia bacterium]
MRVLLQDFRYGLRVLIKSPGFTLVAVFALALGIGANSAIFSVVNAVLLRPLPYDNPDRLMLASQTGPEIGTMKFSPADFLDLREQSQSFDGVGGVISWKFNLTGAGDPEVINGVFISSNMLDLLGVRPVIGRNLLPEEETPENKRVVLISHAIWKNRFNSDEAVIGKKLNIDTEPYIIIGVMPSDFQFPRPAFETSPKGDVWVPIAFNPTLRKNRDIRYIRVIGRLKNNVTIRQAQAEVDMIAQQLASQYPTTNDKIGIKLQPLSNVGNQNVQLGLWILMGVVGFVLLIACANVANLLLAKAASRKKEIAIRMALGASRRRLVRQLLSESLLLSLVSGALAVLLAWGGIRLLVSISPDNIPRLEEVGLDFRALGFTLAASLLTAMLFGVIPALQLSKVDLTVPMKEASRSSSGGVSFRRLRSLLVVSEVSLALILVIAAGLLIRSFLSLQEVKPGFDANNLLTMQIPLPEAKYVKHDQKANFYQALLARLEGVPGIQSASVISAPPLTNGYSVDFSIEGHQPLQPGQRPYTEYRLISPDYFKTMGIPLLKGRYFSDRDGRDSPGVVIINETMARRFFPDEDPVGKHLGLSTPEDKREIVGVVGDVKEAKLDADPKPTSYIPYIQNAPLYLQLNDLYLAIRSETDPSAMTATARSQVRAVDPDQPVSNIRTMEQVISLTLSSQRFLMLLLSIFAGLALLLAAVGVYGVMSYSVTQRTQEIGIRMALGAQQGDVLKLIVSQGMVLVIIGITVGLATAIAVTRIMSSLLYGISTTDLVTLVGASSLLGLIALAASYVPARKATSIDPIMTLREE